VRPSRDQFRPSEWRVVERLRDPLAVQRWLNSLPYNWQRHGETARTFRGVVERGRAQCLEAATAGATILEQHGYSPTIVDIESVDELDHVIFVYRRGGKWGSVARSRCVGLHGRRPVYSSLEALVRSYVAPFIDQTGRVKGYGLLDLDTLDAPWRLGKGNVWAVEQALYDNDHMALPTPEAVYRKWKVRFDAWWLANGKPEHRWPDFYPDRRKWTAP
jgi:hypothetical protein